MRTMLAAVFAGTIAATLAGGALAQTASVPVKTDRYAIDAEGTITVEDDFVDEMYCVLETITDDTAEKAGAALAVGAWPAEVDRDFQASSRVCIDGYDWWEEEGQFGILLASTQTLINHATEKLKSTSIDYDDVVEIENGLSSEQSAKFRDGTWLQDTAMVAKLQGDLKARGLTDPNLMSMGEMAVGAYANQLGTVRAWVEFLNAKS